MRASFSSQLIFGSEGGIQFEKNSASLSRRLRLATILERNLMPQENKFVLEPGRWRDSTNDGESAWPAREGSHLSLHDLRDFPGTKMGSRPYCSRRRRRLKRRQGNGILGGEPVLALFGEPAPSVGRFVEAHFESLTICRNKKVRKTQTKGFRNE